MNLTQKIKKLHQEIDQLKRNNDFLNNELYLRNMMYMDLHDLIKSGRKLKNNQTGELYSDLDGILGVLSGRINFKNAKNYQRAHKEIYGF